MPNDLEGPRAHTHTESQPLPHEDHEPARRFLNLAQVMFIGLNPEGVVELVNPYAAMVLGYSPEEIRGENWFDRFLPERVREEVRGVFDQIVHGERDGVERFENPVLTKSGAERVVEWRNIEVHDSEGRIVGTLGCGTDITELRQTAAQLRQREDYLRAVLEAAVESIVTIDRHGVIVHVNDATEKMFGHTKEELLGRNVNILMPPPYRDEHDGYIARYLATAEPHIIGIGREVVAQRKDGTIFPVDLSVSQNDHRGIFTGIIRDITERKQAESEVRRLQKEVVDAVTIEQERMGRELHDDVGQELRGLAFSALALYDRLRAAGQEAEAGRAQRLKTGLETALEKVRRISRGLVAADLDGLLFSKALSNFAGDIAATHGIECRFTESGDPDLPGPSARTHLFRIAQEAVSNAVYHASPARIDISLTSKDNCIRLVVQDDGGGFTVRDRDSQGLGLRIMRHRAELLGGTLTIHSLPGQGTTVDCVLKP